jgi:hypothetical protein
MHTLPMHTLPTHTLPMLPMHTLPTLPTLPMHTLPTHTLPTLPTLLMHTLLTLPTLPTHTLPTLPTLPTCVRRYGEKFQADLKRSTDHLRLFPACTQKQFSLGVYDTAVDAVDAVLFCFCTVATRRRTSTLR